MSRQDELRSLISRKREALSAEPGLDVPGQDVAFVLKRQRIDTLAVLNTAASRLDQPGNNVGRCQNCGEPIGLERLEEVFLVALCGDCEQVAAAGRPKPRRD